MLWHGALPSHQQLEKTRLHLISCRVLPESVRRVLEKLDPDQDMMSVLRTAVSACRPSQEWPPTVEDAMMFTAMLPTVIAYRWALQSGRAPIEPDPELSHVANYLYMLTGKRPDPAIARALEAYMVITMEHGLNASTFAARVVTSTRSDMASALCAALGAMKGPLHGGAPLEVRVMLEQIGATEHAEPWLRRELEAGRRLMGFGHRVYKTRDPRAVALRSVVESLQFGDPSFDLAVQVEDLAIRLLEEYKPGRHLYTNVEYWAAAILGAVGIPNTLFTASFSASVRRVDGAHPGTGGEQSLDPTSI
ncbi:citrate/2-methylcitrate synthase [Alicyclobacillus sacchari]|uniref:citrate/2-methylcitrate synthase n=1 Tax=Alicyclobacillus sacchari TaxID=392010 RepID=UPI0024E17DB2|nr:citrate/2-methylcitrate synthase [Alicyclobacillus sacchari]